VQSCFSTTNAVLGGYEGMDWFHMPFDGHNPAAVAELEEVRHLTVQHYHHGSLENVVTMSQPPGTSAR
jgi:hypothetical protein